MSYLCDLFFIFICIFITINYNLMNTDTIALLLIFYNMSYYFRMKNVNNFSMALIIKVLPIKKSV